MSSALETVSDDIDDDTHAKLDQQVSDAVHGEPFNPRLLLTSIVCYSREILESPLNARQLLEEHEDLVGMLKVAWETKSYKTIRNLRILRSKPTNRIVAAGVPVKQQHAVIQAFHSEYHGCAYKVLLQAVDEVHAMPAEMNYAKLVPVAQSSGMGKSKTVDKIATERILFPLCLREDLGADYYAYPPTDIGIRNYFLEAPSTGQEEECKAHLRSFFCTLFERAHLLAEEIFPEDVVVSYEDMAKAIYEYFKDPSKRNSFYKCVISNVRTTSSTEVLDSFKTFEDYLKQHCRNWPNDSCPVLISMDEIHVLFKFRPQDGSTYDLYSRLKSVLSEAASAALCVIFLSTATGIPKLAPSQFVAPSIRERDTGRLLPAPFMEFPFDAHIINDPLVPEKESLDSVGTLEYTAKFGRPLFYATYMARKAQNEPQETIVLGMMLIVREKLCGLHWPPTSPAGLDVSSIAVLSARLLIDLCPTSSKARQYEEELVRCHLRMLYSVHQNRLSLVTGSSPEPLIAEAAAQIMHHRIGSTGNEKPYMDVWDLLGKYVDEGLAPQGTVGELIGRVLSISAMDNAIEALPDRRELKFQTPVSVIDYYKAFLTDAAWDILRLSTPANRSELTNASRTRTFEEAFTNAYFHFSHYGRANDTSPISDRLAWALWLRGTAVLCQPNQQLTDRAYPIFFSEFGTLSPQSMSLALNQDKTGKHVDPHLVGIQSAETLQFFSPGNQKPYIAAVHCYALTEKEGMTVETSTGHDLRAKNRDEAAPRYQIDFRGLASYRGITEQTKDEIRRIIDGSKNTLFNQHPRKYGMQLLRQMLPVMQGDADATKWFLNSPSKGPTPEKRKGGPGDGPSGGDGPAPEKRKAGPSKGKQRKSKK